jgi:hypothetical protein
MSLSTEELTLLRSEAVVWQPEVCDIYRLTTTEDEFGGSGAQTETVIAASIPCSVEPGAGHSQMIQMLGLERPDTTFIVYLPAGVDVDVNDHLIVTTKGNEHMRVTAVMAPETHEIERMVICNSLGEHHA